MAIMSARYTVIDGEVVAQERSGVRHQLVPDPLGSTVALYDNSETKTDTFSYWPYGESATRTGVTVAKFQYVGKLGYFNDSGKILYIRRRSLDTQKGIWISEDPVYRTYKESLYLYCNVSPVNFTDASGLRPCGKDAKLWCTTYCGPLGVKICREFGEWILIPGIGCIGEKFECNCNLGDRNCDKEKELCIADADYQSGICGLIAAGLLGLCETVCIGRGGSPTWCSAICASPVIGGGVDCLKMRRKMIDQCWRRYESCKRMWK